MKEMGSHEHALHIFQKAIDLQADNANAHNNLGNVLKLMGKLDRAYDSYSRAIKIKPSFEDALTNRWGCFSTGEILMLP